VAEWLVTRHLGVHLAASGVQRGFDATDGRGRTYQIKSRIVRCPRERTSFDFRDLRGPFDHLICVFFSPEFEVLRAVRVPRAVVRALARQNRGRVSFRWSGKTAGDRRIVALAIPPSR
jgi:hypothetical protein